MPLRRSALWSDPRVKPPHGVTEIDWAHPLANGLVQLLLLAEGGGNTLHDALGWTPSPLTASPTWGLTAAGLGVEFNGTTQYALNAVRTPALKDFTICCRFSTVTAAQGMVYGVDQDTVSGLVHVRLNTDQAGSSAANKTQLVVRDTESAGPRLVCMTQAGLYTGAPHDLVVTRQGATTAMYYDGVSQSLTVGTNALGATETVFGTRPLALGARNSNGTATLFGALTLLHFALFGRLLAPEEIAWLTAEPYAMLRPLVRRRYLVAAGVPPDVPAGAGIGAYSPRGTTQPVARGWA